MCPAKPLYGVTVCYFGHYNPDYPRHRVLRKALQRAGAEIVHANDHSLGLVRYIKLFTKSLRQNFDVMIVAFPSHTDMPVARIVCSLKRAHLIFDPLVSLYESAADREGIHPKNLIANKRYWIDKIACQLADIVLSDSDASTHFFVDVFGLQEAKFRRLWVGADDDILKPSIYDLEKSAFTVFFTGSFIPLQGIEYIIHAAKILEQRGENVQFVIVGTGQTFSRMADLVSDLAVRNVQFKGRVPFEQLSGLMSEAQLSLGIFGTSAKAQHGIPNKVLFALATKRPVLTGDTPAMREIFTHGENIWLCPMGDAAALADSIIELKRRPDVRGKVAQAGYELFVKEFSVDAVKREVVSIILDASMKWGDLHELAGK